MIENPDMNEPLEPFPFSVNTLCVSQDGGEVRLTHTEQMGLFTSHFTAETTCNQITVCAGRLPSSVTTRVRLPSDLYHYRH